MTGQKKPATAVKEYSKMTETRTDAFPVWILVILAMGLLVFMSGYTANVIVHHGVLDPGVHFMQKPFSMDDIAAKVREMMMR